MYREQGSHRHFNIPNFFLPNLSQNTFCSICLFGIFILCLLFNFFARYIPPDKREENDQSTHKWMVYVRGSRREPSINHFVKKVWFFLHPSYKPNDLVEVR